MPRPYPPEFRRRALELVESGRSVRGVAASLGIAESCLHRWRKHDLVARGLKPAGPGQESAELAAARRRIREPRGAGQDPLQGCRCGRGGGAPKSPVRHRRPTGR